MHMTEADLKALLERKPTSQKTKVQALGRMKAGQMNKTEQRYADHLFARLAAKEIAWFKFEPMTLKLAEKTTYTPDFMVMQNDGRLEIHEVKGFWLDDARVKIKMAAELFPFQFIGVQADGASWKYENF